MNVCVEIMDCQDTPKLVCSTIKLYVLLSINIDLVRFTAAAKSQPSQPGLIDCGKTIFNASYVQTPPFVFTKRSGIVGAIANPLSEAVSECCGTKVSVSYSTRHDHLRQLEENVGDEDLIVPVLRNNLAKVSGISGYEYVPILQTTGIVIISLYFSLFKEYVSLHPFHINEVNCHNVCVFIHLYSSRFCTNWVKT